MEGLGQTSFVRNQAKSYWITQQLPNSPVHSALKAHTECFPWLPLHHCYWRPVRRRTPEPFPFYLWGAFEVVSGCWWATARWDGDKALSLLWGDYRGLAWSPGAGLGSGIHRMQSLCTKVWLRLGAEFNLSSSLTPWLAILRIRMYFS